MKKISAMILGVLVTHCIKAQNTNTFPNDGNVGIGTTSPLRPLHIIKSTANNAILFGLKNLANGGGLDFGNATGGDASFIPYIRGTSFTTNRPYGLMLTSLVDDVNPYTSGYDSVGAAIVIDARTKTDGLLTQNNILAVRNSYKPYFVIKANGFTGVNMLNPQAPLHVSSRDNGIVAKFSFNHLFTNSDPYLSITNATSANDEYLPSIVTKSLLPSTNAYGFILMSMANDLSPNDPANIDPKSAAIVFDARTKSSGVLQNSNILAVRSRTNTYMTIRSNGNMLLGTTQDSPHKLTVEGSVGARKVVVKQDAWADFVYNDDYDLLPISELAAFIQKNKHLPGIPTTKEVEENGQDIGEMNKLLLQKVEELTLYMLELKKENDALKERVQKLEKQ